MTELFPVEPCPSLRLQWLTRHGLILTKLPNGEFECALDEENRATGDSEDAACAAFAEKTGLKYREGWWT